MSYLQRKTRRLVIRVLKRSDYLRWKTAHSNMLQPKNIFDRKNRKPEELSVRAFSDVLNSQKKMRETDRFYDFAVFHKQSGEMVGRAGIMDIQRGLTQSAYLGYTIFNRHWSRGYGKESVRAIIDIAFRDLGLHRVEAGIEPNNRRSIFLARSLGLRKEGLKKRAVMMRNQWVDLIMYSATTEDFGIQWKGRTGNRPH